MTPIPVDLVIVAANQILDRLYEAARNTCLDVDAVLHTFSLTRADVERHLEIFGEKILKHNRL